MNGVGGFIKSRKGGERQSTIKRALLRDEVRGERVTHTELLTNTINHFFKCCQSNAERGC